MKKSQISVLLSKLSVFDNPDSKLEQYPTDGNSASELLWSAFQLGDIENRTIADFGCGTGILGIGALMLGAKKVYFVDKDTKAIEKARQNLEFAEKEIKVNIAKNAVFINSEINKFDEKPDTIIQNPPFGTKNEHADRLFLEKAFESSKVIYSIHKASTLPFLRKLIESNRRKITNELYLKMQLKNTMAWHKRKMQLIDAVCLRII